MKSHKGVGLIEVLVSIVIVSIAVLGTLALQTKTLQKSQEVYLFNQSHFLANDLFERLRGNQSHVQSLVNSTLTELTVTDFSTESTDITGVSNCSDPSVLCTSTQLLVWDIQQFKQELEHQLGEAPQAKVMVHYADVGSVESVIVSLSLRFQGSIFSESSTGVLSMNYEQFDFETRL